MKAAPKDLLEAVFESPDEPRAGKDFPAVHSRFLWLHDVVFEQRCSNDVQVTFQVLKRCGQLNRTRIKRSNFAYSVFECPSFHSADIVPVITIIRSC